MWPRLALLHPAPCSLLLGAAAVAQADPSAAPAAAALGRAISFEASLSASAPMSRASCHSPTHAQAQPIALAVESGGAGLDVPGFRSVPSLRNLNGGAFLFDEDGTPAGGLHRDGRAASLLEQAARAFLVAHAIANGAAAAVATKLPAAAYADDFRRLFGVDAFDDAGIDDPIAFLHTLTDGYDVAIDRADPARNLPP